MSPNSDSKGINSRQPKPTAAVRPVGRIASAPQEEESLRNSIRVLRKRKFLVLWWTLGSVAIALLICVLMKPQYTATATLLVDKQSGGGMDLTGLSSLASAVGGADDLKNDLQTHATLLESPSTMLQVVKDQNLTKYKPYAYVPGLSALWEPELKAEQGLPLEKAPAMRERLITIMHDRLAVTPTQDTRLLTIAYRDYDPQRAAAIANDFVNTYIHEYLEMKFHATAEASDWLTGQLNTLKARVEQTQQALADYERQTGLSVMMVGMSANASGTGGGGSMAGGVHIPAVDRLAALNQEVTTAEADRISKEAIYRLTQTENPEVVLGLSSSSLASGSGSSVMSAGGGLSVLQTLRGQEAALQSQYGDLLSKYGPKNPHLLELQGQMAALDHAMQAEMDRIRERAKNDFELAKKDEDSIKQTYKAQTGEVSKLNDSTVRLELLEGEAVQSAALYEDLYGKLQAANISAGVQATNLSNVDPAMPPYAPSRPLWGIYPAIGFAAGLLLGIVAAFVRENLDDSIVTPDQVEETAWFPVLSHIPIAREADLASSKPSADGTRNDPSFLISRPSSPISESYRALRTAIQLSTVDVPLRTLLFTSPMGSDGKTTTTYNMAIAFAQKGIRVLLIDADMRKPRLHNLMGIPRAPGLSEVLTNGVRFNDAVRQHASVLTLFQLPAGTYPPNPADLLGSKHMETLLEEALKQYDLVVLDSPPMLMVTDPVILSTKVDGTILVVRSGQTTKTLLRRASEMLLRSSGRTLGIVINGLDTRSVEYYYSYGYYGDNEYNSEEG